MTASENCKLAEEQEERAGRGWMLGGGGGGRRKSSARIKMAELAGGHGGATLIATVRASRP